MKKKLKEYVQETSERIGQAVSAKKALSVLIELLIQSNSDTSLKDNNSHSYIETYLQKRILDYTEELIFHASLHTEEIKKFHSVYKYSIDKENEETSMIEILENNLYLLNHFSEQGNLIKKEFTETKNSYLAAVQINERFPQWNN
jgi:hypothetical protein